MTETSVRLNVQGMSCAGCAAAVTRIIQKSAPAATVSVDLAAGTATVTSGTSPAPPASSLAAALTSAGYPSAPQTT